MLKHLPLVLLAVASGFLIATWWPAAPDAVRALLARARPAATVPSREPIPAAPEPEKSGRVRLTDAQIAKAGIRKDDAGEGRLARHLHVPGTIVPSADKPARIAVRTTGTVVELRKRLGDRVAKGEVVALIESREIAETKGEYLAARLSAALQKTLYERDKELWDRRISSEQQYCAPWQATKTSRSRRTPLGAS